MRKIIYSLSVLVVMAASVISCTKNKLDNVDPIENEQRSVTGDGVITDQITQDNETVRIPFKITLNAPASKAFQVAIKLNSDTVNQLITNGTLENTIIMPNGGVDYPNVLKVEYGATTATGVAVVRLTPLERNWGKKIAFAFKLSDPGKSNQIDSKNSNILVVVDTKAIIKEEDIHYLSFVNGGGIMDVDFQKNYVSGNAGITIPLVINLAGKPSSAFNVHVRLNRDTIAQLVKAGKLPSNAIALDSGKFALDTLIRIASNRSTATARLQIEWPVFDANIQANKRFAFAISLEDANKHVLHPTKSKMIVLVQPEVNLDNNSYITGNGTGLKAEYFNNNQLLDFDKRDPDLIRLEPRIEWNNDGDWQNSMPRKNNVPVIGNDNFSTRWTGEFLAPVRGEYRFWQNEWDDGARLYVDGKAIVNDFTTEWDKESRNGTIFLERGKRYKIEVHHRENVGGQRARLTYEVLNVFEGRRIVPTSQLFPAPGIPGI